MRALAIVHQRDAGPGVFADAFGAEGVELDYWHLPEADRPPAPVGDYGAVMTFGGAMHADQEAEHAWIAPETALLAELLESGTPLLGVCLGSQLLAAAAGGEARRAREPEIGWYEVEVTPEGADDPLVGPLAPRFEAFEWHSYEFERPPGATALARSEACLQAYRIGAVAWGIQFHAEVSAVDAMCWIDDYRSDEVAVRILLNAEALRAETEAKIAAWNDVGRALCDRFRAVAGVEAAPAG
jgi:GMP synthase-like glutamine amidotransferase